MEQSSVENNQFVLSFCYCPGLSEQRWSLLSGLQDEGVFRGCSDKQELFSHAQEAAAMAGTPNLCGARLLNTVLGPSLRSKHWWKEFRKARARADLNGGIFSAGSQDTGL